MLLLLKVRNYQNFSIFAFRQPQDDPVVTSTPVQLKSSDKKYLALSFLYLTVFGFTLSKAGHAYDKMCFIIWAENIYENGIGYVYNTNTNYLPLFHLMLRVYVSMQSSFEEVASHIHFLKVFSLIFMLITGYFMVRIMELVKISRDNLVYNVFFFLINIAVLYNGLIWNQVDIILGSLVFVSAFFAIKQKTFWSLLFLLLSLNFKPQAIIFIPVIGLMVLPDLVRAFRTGRIVIYIGILALVQVLILLPFIFAGSVHRISEVTLEAVGNYSFISNRAYNIWYLLVSGDVPNIRDSIRFLGITYKSWGLVMFLVASGIALFPLMKQCYFKLFSEKRYDLPPDRILMIFALIPLLFFYFNTQMHERYSHQALAFLVIVGVIRKQPVPAFLGSLAYLLNLEDELRYLDLQNYNTLIFDPDFVALLYLVTISWLYFDLFRKRAHKTILD